MLLEPQMCNMFPGQPDPAGQAAALCTSSGPQGGHASGTLSLRASGIQVPQ